MHRATAGNPLALLELAADAGDPVLTPEGAPLLVSARISRAFLRRAETLDAAARRALVLAATSDTRDLPMLARAAARLGVDLAKLAAAENLGLVKLQSASVEFCHPLARSAVYAEATPEQRREAHRALAAVLPDRDVDRRAWHLAAAATGADDAASAALEQAAARSRDRSAYAIAASAFERAARLTDDAERRARLLWQAAEAAWNAGLAGAAVALLDEARESTNDHITLVQIDQLAGHIATRRGPVMLGHQILIEAAQRAEAERAVVMLAEAASACFYAGDPAEMLSVAERGRARLPHNASVRARFLTAVALGMAQVVGGDAAAGAAAIHEAIALAERSADVRGDPQMLPWLAVAPIFLREADTGRSLLDHALSTARARAALGTLPFVLNLIARDQATTDRWDVAEATYREAIDLARESGQQTELVFGLAGLAWLHARHGRELECRSAAAEAFQLSSALGTRLHEIWATAALGELELGIGHTAEATQLFEHQHERLTEFGITDVDLSPAASSSTSTADRTDATMHDAFPSSSTPPPRRRDSPGRSLARCAVRDCSPATATSPKRSSRLCTTTRGPQTRSKRQERASSTASA